MDLNQLGTLLNGIYPTAYWSFPKGKAPAMPFICYFEDGSDNFGADNKVWHSFKQIHVELYTKTKDPASEAKLEAMFYDQDIFWEKQETHLDDEDVYEVIYTMEV